MRKILHLVLISLFFNQCLASLENVTNSYNNQLRFSQKESSQEKRQIAYNNSKEHAKVLLGVMDGLDISFLNKTVFFKQLAEKASEIQKDLTSENEKITLRAKRDISNLNEIFKYFKCCLKLLNALYASPEVLDLVLMKIPEFVPQLGKEISLMLSVLELIMKNPAENFSVAIEKIRDFSKQSEDGTYLLSPLLSIAMKAEDYDSLDFKNILQETDFSNLDICDYFNVK